MRIRPLDTSSPKDRRAWIELPHRLYAAVPQWVPPLRGAALFPFDRETNPFYVDSEAAFFGAWHGDQLVGRIAVLDNRRYNEHNHTRAAFFTLFEAEDDDAVARELFAAAMDWARARGLDELRGPRGFSPLDGLGLLVQGFEYLPAMGIPYNPPYYPRLIEAQGVAGIEDLRSGYIERTAVIPPEMHTVAERVMARRGLRVATYTSKRELRTIVPDFRQLYNRSLALVGDNYPLTEAEIGVLAKQLLAIAEPELLKLVYRGDELAGFILAYPNIGAGLQRCHGRLWPLGWTHLLAERRRTVMVDVNGMGIAQEHQGLGSATVLLSTVIKTLLDSRFQRAELVQIRASNDRMLREMARLPIAWAKVHRVYARAL